MGFFPLVGQFRERATRMIGRVDCSSHGSLTTLPLRGSWLLRNWSAPEASGEISNTPELETGRRGPCDESSRSRRRLRGETSIARLIEPYNLHGKRVTDAGLKEIKTLENLQMLNLKRQQHHG